MHPFDSSSSLKGVLKSNKHGDLSKIILDAVLWLVICNLEKQIIKRRIIERENCYCFTSTIYFGRMELNNLYGKLAKRDRPLGKTTVDLLKGATLRGLFSI